MCVSVRYNKLTGQVKALAMRLKELDSKDPFRNRATTDLLEKLQVCGYHKQYVKLCFIAISIKCVRTL